MARPIKLSGRIEGWLSTNEAGFLYETAKKLGGNIVEIGSWKGKSTVCLACGLKDRGGGKVYAVDHHMGLKGDGSVKTFREFKANIKDARISDYVFPMVMKSKDAAKKWGKDKKPISLLWIDGSHEYEDVRQDVLLWKTYLRDGGVIALHDTFLWDGPKRVVDEVFFSGDFSEINFVDSITYAKKTKTAGKIGRMRLEYKKIIRKIILIRNVYGPHRIKEAFASRKKLRV